MFVSFPLLVLKGIYHHWTDFDFLQGTQTAHGGPQPRRVATQSSLSNSRQVPATKKGISVARRLHQSDVRVCLTGCYSAKQARESRSESRERRERGDVLLSQVGVTPTNGTSRVGVCDKIGGFVGVCCLCVYSK